MCAYEVILKRRSIRKYVPEPIEREALIKILEAARRAPSAGNRQPWYFIVVKDPELKKEVAKASANQMFMANADVIIVGVADPGISPRWYEKDIMIALEHIALVATELGLGTCWIGAFNERKIKELLEIPENLKVVALMPVGVPAESPGPRPRKPLEEIVFLNKFRRKFEV